MITLTLNEKKKQNADDFSPQKYYGPFIFKFKTISHIIIFIDDSEEHLKK